MEITPAASTFPRLMPMNGAALSTTGTTTGAAVRRPALSCCYHLVSAGGGATVVIEYSNEYPQDGNLSGFAPTNWVNAQTLTLAGAGSIGYADSQPVAWRWARARTTANSGTGAQVYMAG